eukprot:scaffold554734_cov39-Prasinocladus_malaysianus.AAC.1
MASTTTSTTAMMTAARTRTLAAQPRRPSAGLFARGKNTCRARPSVSVAVSSPPNQSGQSQMSIDDLEAGERARLERGDAFEELKRINQASTQSVNRPQ